MQLPGAGRFSKAQCGLLAAPNTRRNGARGRETARPQGPTIRPSECRAPGGSHADRIAPNTGNGPTLPHARHQGRGVFTGQRRAPVCHASVAHSKNVKSACPPTRMSERSSIRRTRETANVKPYAAGYRQSTAASQPRAECQNCAVGRSDNFTRGQTRSRIGKPATQRASRVPGVPTYRLGSSPGGAAVPSACPRRPARARWSAASSGGSRSATCGPPRPAGPRETAACAPATTSPPSC